MIATISSSTKRSSESNLKTVKKPSTQSSSRIRVILWGEKSNKSYSWVHEFNFVNILQPYYKVLQKVWSNPNVGPTHIFNTTRGSCKVGVAKQEFLSTLKSKEKTKEQFDKHQRNWKWTKLLSWGSRGLQQHWNCTGQCTPT
jgi:hypothetical protein